MCASTSRANLPQLSCRLSFSAQLRTIAGHLRQVLLDLPRAVTVNLEMADLDTLGEMAEQNGACGCSMARIVLICTGFLALLPNRIRSTRHCPRHGGDDAHCQPTGAGPDQHRSRHLARAGHGEMRVGNANGPIQPARFSFRPPSASWRRCFMRLGLEHFAFGLDTIADRSFLCVLRFHRNSLQKTPRWKNGGISW